MEEVVDNLILNLIAAVLVGSCTAREAVIPSWTFSCSERSMMVMEAAGSISAQGLAVPKSLLKVLQARKLL